MYVPHFNAMDEAAARALVAAKGSAELITTGADGYPLSTLVPVLWEGDRVVAHLARANAHAKAIGADTPALLVCTGPEAYISPSWYAAKAEHGKVVPTWNYSAVHLSGRARIVEDVDWLRELVTRLTDAHESGRPDRWRVSDAPTAYIDKMLRAIVGVELVVERVEAKAKLSQNRSEADRAGVVAGLGDHPVAEAMRADRVEP